MPTRTMDNIPLWRGLLSNPTDGDYHHDDPEDGGISRFEPCRYYRSQLDDYLDQELLPELVNSLEMHLEVCPRCAEWFRKQIDFNNQIDREWRRQTSLPTNLQVQTSIDSILQSLFP